MKVELKEVDYKDLKVEQQIYGSGIMGCGIKRVNTYSFTTTELIEDLVVCSRVEVPETLEEFARFKKIDKHNLVEWLNENYK